MLLLNNLLALIQAVGVGRGQRGGSKTLQAGLSFQRPGVLFKTRVEIHWSSSSKSRGAEVTPTLKAQALYNLNFLSRRCFLPPQGIRQKLHIKALLE